MQHTANSRTMDSIRRGFAGQRLDVLIRYDNSVLHVHQSINAATERKCVDHILESKQDRKGQDGPVRLAFCHKSADDGKP